MTERKTERLARAKAYRDELNAKFRSYDGGDRPMSPPASFIRELSAAEQRVRDIEAHASEEARAEALACAECHRSIGREVAHVDCDCPEMGLVSDEQGYRSGNVASAVQKIAAILRAAEDLWMDYRTKAEISSARLLTASHRSAFLAGLAAGQARRVLQRAILAAEHAREPLCPDSHREHPGHTIADEEGQSPREPR